MNDKIHNKDLTLKEFIKLLGWSERKFYDNIELMCQKDTYDIDIGAFKKAGKTKEEYIKDENSYDFKKEWNDIALLLFKMYSENPYFRGNRNARKVSIDSVIEYNTKFLKNIRNDLNTYNSLEVQLHPVYTYTVVETYAMRKIKEKIELFLYSISKMPIEARAETMLEFNRKIDEIIINSYVNYGEIKEEIEDEKEVLFKKQLYGELENISLDKYIAQVLKREMSAEFRKERDELNKKAQEIRDSIDNFVMSLDSKEEIEAVNKFWEQYGDDDVLKLLKEKILKKQIEENIKIAKIKVENSSNIEKKIDELIVNENKNKTLKTKKRLKRLNELKNMICQDSNKTDFEKIAENLLQEINFSVINRK